jgi:hypothetical protein
MTALNLFTTKFDQVLDLVEKRAENVECAAISSSSLRIDSHGRAASSQLCGDRHTRSDRDLYLVSVWRHHYRRCCVFAPNCHCLHCRHPTCYCACDVHVEYAICVQVCSFAAPFCLFGCGLCCLHCRGALDVSKDSGPWTTGRSTIDVPSMTHVNSSVSSTRPSFRS